MDKIKQNAYAKINLGLDVVRRLENGYHEVSMIMQTVSLCDKITICKNSKGIRGVHKSFRLFHDPTV